MIGCFARLGAKHFDRGVVGVAVRPVLARLVRADDGVLRSVKMPRGVLPGRIVAAAHVAARQAKAQVNPNAAGLKALHTSRTARRGAMRTMLRLFQMRTRGDHGASIARRLLCGTGIKPQ
jgi:hypothetical protein